MNKASGLPLTIGQMGELIKNNELGRRVAAEGFNRPTLNPFTKGQKAR